MARQFNNQHEKYTFIPLDEIVQPKSNATCIADHWWEVRDGCVLGFKLYGPKSKARMSPQCNSNEYVAKRIAHVGSEVVFIPVAYWPL